MSGPSENYSQPSMMQDTVNMRMIISRYVQRWPVFLLCALVSLTLSYVYLKYQEPVYQVKSKLLIKNKSSMDDPTQMLFGRQFLRNLTDVPNQSIILVSSPILTKAIERTRLNISYYRENRFRTLEMYQNAPFKVEVVDSLIERSTKYRYSIINLSDKGFELSTEDKIDGVNTGKYAFGEVISLAGTKVKITLRKGANKKPEGTVDPYEYWFLFKSNSDLIKSFRRKIEITENSGSSIVDISLKDNIPQRAKDFLNNLLEVYIEANLAEKNQVVDSTVAFIDRELKSITDSLYNKEADLERFQSGLKVPDLSMQGELLLKEMTDLEEKQNEISVRDKYFDYIRKKLDEEETYDNLMAPAAFGVEDPVLNETILTVIGLQVEKNRLVNSGAGKVGRVAEIDSEIADFKKIIRKSIEDLTASNDILSKALTSKLHEVEAVVKRLPKSEREYVNLKRLLNLNEGIYIFLMERRANALITKSSSTPDCKVIDPPYTYPEYPISPNKKMIRIIWFLSGLFIPLGFMVGYDTLNDKIKSRDELTAITNIPLLGQVPHFNKKTERISVAEYPKSSLAEAFRIIRTNLEFYGESGKGKTVLITSSVAGEGKTFCAINLAGILAMSGNKTLVVGLDLRKPQLHNYLNVTNDVGMSTYLAGKSSIEEIIQKSLIDDLDVIPSGPIPPNPAELLLRDKMAEFLGGVQKEYDFVILDTTPSQLVSDAQILMKHSDANVFITRQGKTTRDMLQNINKTNSSGKYSNATIIFNDVPPKKTYGYGYGYGYYEETKMGFWDKLKAPFKR